jgi:hypothetical protein
MIMSLKAGTPSKISGKYYLDNTTLADSMALEIDNQMKALFEAIKGKSMPDDAQLDRRMLFTAISRGILKYLKDHADDFLSAITVTHTTGTSVTHSAATSTDLGIQVDAIP